MPAEKKAVIGLVAEVVITGKAGNKGLTARVDTGATKSSLDTKLAASLNLGPVLSSKLVKSAHGNRLRPVVEAELAISGKTIKAEFTLADRSHMKYKCLIGQNILRGGFLIDPDLK